MSHLPSKAPILEIGSFCGLSTNVITYLKKKHGLANKLICSDAWRFFEGAEKGGSLGGHPYIQLHEYEEFVKLNFIKNISFFSGYDLPFPVEMFSDKFFANWEVNADVSDIFNRKIKLGGSISFAYIDGNHSYEFALRDFKNVDKYLELGGFILFDDSSDGSGWEVCEVVAEVNRSERYQLIKKNPNYLFKKVKNI
ncbi:class I SAM-dependent methyltransferase [Chroococcidiopsis sp. CCMEE 29]|uniref:class I SAM-dependent methyltransferase n=1 Tax=Chroococcidiopsis sp. CCMEE 29 TaxID=155894 RepID=UPI0031F7B571